MSADATVPGPGVDAGATNTSDPHQTAPDHSQPVSGQLRDGNAWEAVAALAALLEPEAFDPNQPADETWREVTQNRALGHAAKVLTLGYRRVVEDDDTTERLVGAIAAVSTPTAGPLDPREYYRRVARAAVRALREGPA